MTEMTGDHIINYGGEDMAIKDVPDPAVRQMLGYGHIDHTRRSVIAVEGRTWESTPDVCTFGDRNWEWVSKSGSSTHDGPMYLVCPKCGLDGT